VQRAAELGGGSILCLHLRVEKEGSYRISYCAPYTYSMMKSFLKRIADAKTDGSIIDNSWVEIDEDEY